ncbi:MAG: manganese efflux pump MntP family protein [Pseudomonadota bacterium]
MSWWTILLLAFALSLDATAVSISCGIKLSIVRWRKYTKIALMFGAFQAVMPLIGWLIGGLVKDYVSAFDHWIAFAIFMALGAKTLWEARSSEPAEGNKNCASCYCQSWSCLFGLALATSIDALVVGFIFSLYQISLLLSVLLIGVITFLMSMAGLFLGQKTHHFLGKKAFVLASLILFALAIKALFS